MSSARGSRLIRTATGWLLSTCLAVPSMVTASDGRADDDLEFLTSVLATSEAPDTRTNAALRLLRLGAPKADLVLAEAIRSGEPELVLVVARALADNGRPPQVVAEALVDVLKTGVVGIGPLAGRTLATLGEAQIQAILAVARSTEVEPPGRIAAIEALGAFRSKAALEPLIDLLHGSNEPEVIEAVTGSLNSITQFDFGSDRQTWLNWWDAVGMMPFEQAINPIAADREQLLGEQRNEIERLATERDLLSDRLQLVLSRWYITITDEGERSEQLRAMLADDIAAVRLFAGNQVDLMLRNGESPDQATINAVRALLGDDVGAIRVLGARLLNRLQVPDVSELLVAAVIEEADPQVAAVILDLIATRPGIEAFDPVVTRLDDPVVSAASSRALVQLIYAGTVPEDWRQQVRGPVLLMHETRVTPATAALLALLGGPSEIEASMKALDHESTDIRSSAARAFLHVRMDAPLLARRDDPVVRPFAIEAFGRQAPTMENLRDLLELEPIEQDLSTWHGSVVRLAGGAPIESRIMIDDLLMDRQGIPLALRSELLAAALGEQTTTDEDARHRLEVLGRYTEVLAEDRRWIDVAKALGQPGLELDSPLLDRLFMARMQLQDFAGASQIHARPEPWISFLENRRAAPEESTVDIDKILVQIRERFGEQIGPELAPRLDALDGGSVRAEAEETDGP